jgi:hypothetical protein
MGAKMHKKGSVLFLAAMFVLAAAILAMPRRAGAVALEEGEVSGGIIPGNVHFVALDLANASTLVQTPDCDVENGISTTVYDGTCTVNNVVENPCVITDATTTIVAKTANCGGMGLTTPGEILTVATSGPLAGCLIGGAYLPWAKQTGAFIIGLSNTLANPIPSITTTGSCPIVGAGGIGVATSFPP